LLCSHFEIFQIMALHVVFLVSSESSRRMGVHQFGLRFFGVMVWKLLIIEPFSQWKLYKIKTENYIGIWGCSWCQKAFNELDVIKFISQFLDIRCGRYWFLSEFCCWKFKKIAKIGFVRKISWAFIVFTLSNLEIFNSKNVKKNKMRSHLGQWHRLH